MKQNGTCPNCGVPSIERDPRLLFGDPDRDGEGMKEEDEEEEQDGDAG